jgi:hypothetical protein
VSEDERNTPQALSHFTYHGSNHTVLVCDIQGVGDMYTDPQMHTVINEGFGKGNLGERGFEKFLQTHRCNAICRYLRLPAINAKLLDEGTKPAQTFMDNRRGYAPGEGRRSSEFYLPPGGPGGIQGGDGSYYSNDKAYPRIGADTPLLRSKNSTDYDPDVPFVSLSLSLSFSLCPHSFPRLSIQTFLIIFLYLHDKSLGYIGVLLCHHLESSNLS